MNRFRLRQLESVLGRGPRSELCQDCGGLSIERISDALQTQDGQHVNLTQAQAQRILDELDDQPRTCLICNDLTSAGELMVMDDLGK